MKFKSPVYSQASGSIAGITYSRNRGGLYARSRAVPTNPSSERQQQIRTCLSIAVTAWKQLSPNDRESWETYAANTPMTDRLGDTIFLTGQQQWLRTAIVCYDIGLDPVALHATAPQIFDLGDTGTLTFDTINVSGSCIFGVGAEPEWAANDNACLLAYFGRKQSASINYFTGPFRYNSKHSGDNTTPITTFQASYGNSYLDLPLEIGQKVFARLTVLQADGRLSTGSILVQEVSS